MKSVYVAAIISITILLVSFCTTLPVQAGVMARSKNDAGGEIVLFDVQGHCAKLYGKDTSLEMMTSMPDGRFIKGCWYYKDGYVAVIYEDGTPRMYDPSRFYMEKGWQNK